MKKININAVHDKDLENFLSEAGILDKVKNGKFSCISCQTTIIMSNIGGIKIENEQVLFVCENDNCLNQYLKNG